MTEGNQARSRPEDIHPVARLPVEWESIMRDLGERPFRARQVFRWVHTRGELEPLAMTDLPKAMRESLGRFGFAPPASVAEVRRSKDGTRKLLLDLERGGRIECVIIPMTDDPEASIDADVGAVDFDEDEPGDDSVNPENGRSPSASAGGGRGARRVTLCISTQVGCAMGCVFCASGQAGLQRGLGAEEIVSQILLARRYLEGDEQLRNLVFMGMGEPLHHYDQTARALRLITHPDGIGMSPRRITVSTVGLVPGIDRLGHDFDGKIGLALSLHAPTDAARDRIIPMNRRFPLGELIAALKRYPLPKRRRITIEYTLIRGENDGVEQARALAELLRGLRVKVNLIPMNPIRASSLSAPAQGGVEVFRDVLASAGLSCFLRKRRGDDVDAACGQLALATLKVEKRDVREGSDSKSR
jgi:23S rRNA (adenine2503-C2)-methyltransferase